MGRGEYQVLTIVYATRGDRIRVVTGYPATRRQRRIYLEG
jgi:uncharacterized DUF497 family protein